MVIKVCFYNFGYWADEIFDNMQDAKNYVKSKGFDASIWELVDDVNYLRMTYSALGSFSINPLR